MELTRRAPTTRGEIAWDVLGEGPPVVLVHGTPSRALVWREVARLLARAYAVHVFDLLGFGASERRVDQDVSLAAHGAVLAELVEQWELDRPALVGHDIGGAAVLRAHLLEGVAVSRLALLDAVVLRPWITPRTRAMQREIGRPRDLPDPDLAAEIEEHLRTATARRLPEDVFGALFGQWSGADGQALYLRNLAQLDERHTDDFEPLLGSIDAPTLVVWGERDEWLPIETSERIAQHVPAAQRLVVPEAGHFCMEDAPGRVSGALAEFLGPG